MKNRWILVGSAPDTDLTQVSELIRCNVPVICADGGMQTALKAGVKPAFFIGDLDSGSKPNDVDGMILPEEKDYTDIHTSLLWAIERGAEDIYILGCTNGRADHYFANILLLEMLMEKGVRGVMMDVQNRIFLHGGGKLRIEQGGCDFFWSDTGVSVPNGFKYVSILPLDRKLSGVTLKGMKYPLDNAELYRVDPIGVSNEMIADVGEIDVAEGRALVIFSKDVK